MTAAASGASISLGPTPALTALDFVNTQDGWIAVGGKILRTLDGGSTWATTYDSSSTVSQLDFANVRDGWATGGGHLLQTTNGGASWQALPGPDLSSLDFVTPMVGFALVGSAPQETTDGGTHWTAITAPDPLTEVCFSNALDGWGLSAPAKTASSSSSSSSPSQMILRTTDGGLTWTATATVPDPVIALSCNASGAAFIMTEPPLSGPPVPKVYNLTLYQSTTGTHWHQAAQARAADTGVAPPWTGLVPAGSSGPAIVVVGAQLFGPSAVTVAESTGEWSGTVPVPLSSSFPTMVTSFTSARNGWIATASAEGWTLATTADGGKTWTSVYSTAPVVPAFAVSFTTATLGYGLGSTATSNPDTLLRTLDGGQTWTVFAHIPATVAADEGAANLFFLNVEDGWATIDNALWATADGGRQWSRVTSGIQIGSLGGNPQIDFVNAQDGCLGTGQQDMGSISYLQTTDGGRTWRPITSASKSLWACAASATRVTGVSAPYCMQQHTAFGTYLVPVGFGSGYYGPTGFWSSGGNLTLAWNDCYDGTGMALFISSNGGRTWSGIRLSGALTTCQLSFATAQDGWCLTSFPATLFRTTNGGRSWAPLLPTGNAPPSSS